MVLVRYRPWLGDEFVALRDGRDGGASVITSGGLPFHILGESHYGQPEEDDAQFTIRTVENCGFSPGPNSRFFAGVLKACLGRPIWEIDRPAAWRTLAFSNYVQHLLDGSRQAPTKEMWDHAAEAFIEQLAIVRAPILVVLGWRLWRHLPTLGGVEIEPLADPTVAGRTSVEGAWAYEYETPVGRRVSLAVPVTHPSGRGFDWQKAHDRIEIAALNYCNTLAHFEERWARQSATVSES